jgi:hypothetical protein
LEQAVDESASAPPEKATNMPKPNAIAALALPVSGVSLVYSFVEGRTAKAPAPSAEDPDDRDRAADEEIGLEEFEARLINVERRLLELELRLLVAEGAPPEVARARPKETLEPLQSEVFAERLSARQVMRTKTQMMAFKRFAEEAQLDAAQRVEFERLLPREEERVSELMETESIGGREGWRGVRLSLRPA